VVRRTLRAREADARAQELPLLTVGDGECVICHDWGYMLGRLGLLSFDTRLPGLVRIAAFIVMWWSQSLGAWMLARMTRKPAPAGPAG
jgi:hypothetical protein